MSLMNYYDHVLYQCACGAFDKFSKLFFCSECKKLACISCCNDAVDTSFCPSCFESTPVGKNEGIRKNFCQNCRLCPICFSTLSLKNTEQDTCFYKCSHCFWTTRESKLQDKTNHQNFCAYKNTDMEKEVGEIEKYLQDLVAFEKPTQRLNQTKKSKVLPNNKYQLGSAYEKKLHLQRNDEGAKLKLPTVKATSDIEEISSSYFTEDIQYKILPSLDQKIAQLNLGKGELEPISIQNTCKKVYRCAADHLLCKLEYSPSTIKFKLFHTAWTILPELKVVLTEQPAVIGTMSHSMFVVKNNHNYKMRLQLTPMKQEGTYVECLDEQVEFTLEAREEKLDYDDGFLNTPTRINDASPLTFRKGCRAGLRFKVRPVVACEVNWLCVLLKFLIAPRREEEQDEEWCSVMVKINTGSSVLLTPS
uniref:Dynactin subunit 4 n=1 Tax=Rhabditophanes sp. KR3021 TaxID=114890 RepID=A0AC35TMW3_9BILA